MGKFSWRCLQEWFEVQYLAQGYFNMPTGGAGDQATDHVISGQPALPPSHNHPLLCLSKLTTKVCFQLCKKLKLKLKVQL